MVGVVYRPVALIVTNEANFILNMKSKEHFKTKYLILSFNFDLFYLLDKTCFERLVSYLLSLCLEPSQPLQVISGLKLSLVS